MDYEALKDQWSEVEDRDGIRLSWNCIPSTRMVHPYHLRSEFFGYVTNIVLGSFATRGTNWSTLHTIEGEARHTSLTI